jgi:peptide/nickel transport system substrate-binding protein
VTPPHRLAGLAWSGVRAVICLVCVAAGASQAASRGQYGGNLRVALAGELPPADPLLADAPADAAILGLASRAVCRLESDQRVVPALAQEIVRPSAQEIRLSVRPGLRAAGGEPIGAAQIAQSWARLSAPETRSPYRALLFPLRGEGRAHEPAPDGALRLSLAFPWPDLEKGLCHPALGVVAQSPQRALRPGHGPFVPGGAPGAYAASTGYVRGRPYADQVSVAAGDTRFAARALGLGEAEIGLGASAHGAALLPAAPALFATYLAFQPKRTGPGLREAVERLVDRADLIRFFVRAPAVPMTSPLPPALMPQQPASRATAASIPAAAPAPAHELSLLYDASVEDQRAVAERLQLKLHDAGYRVAIRGLSRSALRARWASGDFDLMLHAVLLPPVAGPALAILLEVAGRHDLLARELPAIGALGEGAARDARARERARALQPALPLLPLYAQSLRVSASPKVAALDVDGYGVPRLDDAFLSP